MILLLWSLLGTTGLAVVVWIVLRRTTQTDPLRKCWAWKAVVTRRAIACNSCGRSLDIPTR